MNLNLPGNPLTLISDVDSNRDAWLEARKGKISATKIGVILGVNKYKSPLQLWAEETGKIEDDFQGNRYTRYGLILEPFIREILAEELGREVVASNALYQHSRIEFAIASPDAFILSDNLQLAELKTANSRMYREWEDDSAPDAYVLQLQWQMGVTGLSEGYIACLLGGDPANLLYPHFDFDHDMWDFMLSAARDFLHCVQQDVPPEPGPGDSKLIEKIVRRKEGLKTLKEAELIEAETLIPLMLAAKNEKKEIAELLKEKEDEIKTCENKLRLLLGDSTAAEAAGYCFEVSKISIAERIQKGYEYTLLKLKKQR